MNTLVGLPHPFFKTNDDQPLYLREIFFEIDKAPDIPGGDFGLALFLHWSRTMQKRVATPESCNGFHPEVQGLSEFRQPQSIVHAKALPPLPATATAPLRIA